MFYDSVYLSVYLHLFFQRFVGFWSFWIHTIRYPKQYRRASLLFPTMAWILAGIRLYWVTWFIICPMLSLLIAELSTSCPYSDWTPQGVRARYDSGATRNRCATLEALVESEHMESHKHATPCLVRLVRYVTAFFQCYSLKKFILNLLFCLIIIIIIQIRLFNINYTIFFI